MGKRDLPFKFWKNGKYYYFKTPEMKCFKSTGETNKAMAIRHAEKVMAEGRAGKDNPLFRDYAELISTGRDALMQQGLGLKVSILVNGIVRTIGDY